MKQYIIKFTKKGKEWKAFVKGVEWMENEKLYRFEWRLNGFYNFLRGWWSIITKRPGEFYTEKD